MRADYSDLKLNLNNSGEYLQITQFLTQDNEPELDNKIHQKWIKILFLI